MIQKDPNKEYNTYSKFGKGYHWKWLNECKNINHYSYLIYLKLILTRIIKNIKKTNSKTILDAGCGDAVLLYFINKRLSHLKLSGFDFIESAIDFAKKKLKNADLFVFDLRNIFSFKKRYDYIICTEVIDHILPPEPINDLNELRKFHIKILNRLISIANKGVFFTIPTKGEWRYFNEYKENKKEDPFLIKWFGLERF
jgi:2-polyprenyl-3-methyl-5-hydroxy-6-metoxy-1,4-benzoquinol methylase